jgi:tetratricopeptide (TPR) repeat protein
MKRLFPFIISILPIVFSFSTFDSVLHIRFIFLSIAVSIVALLYLFKNKKLVNNYLNHSALLVYLIMIFFYVFSAFYNGPAAYSIFLCLKLSLFYIFSIFIINLIIEYGYKHYCQSVVIFSLLISTIYFLQITDNYDVIDFVFSSTMGNKNLLGSAIFLSLPFLFYTIIIGNKLWRIISYVAIFMAIIILVSVKSMAVIIALIISALSFLILFKRNQINRYIIKAIYICALFFLATFISFNFFNYDIKIKDKISTFIKYRSSARLVLYKSTFKLIKHNLLLGVGPGNWKIKCPEYGVYSTKELDHTYYNGLNFVQRPHNDFLWVFAEAGVFAGLCYIILFLIILRESYLLYKRNVKKERIFYLLLFSTILGYSLISMVDFPLERISHNILFFLIVSIIISGTIKQNNNYKDYASVWVLYLFLSITLFAVYVGYVRYNGEIHATNAIRYKVKNNWPMVIKEINKAYDIHYYEIDNTSTPLLWYRGLAYFQQNQIEKALVDFKQAYKVNPNHIHTLNNIGTCYGNLGEMEKAKEFYNKVLALYPTNKESRMNLAIIYFNENQFTQSLDIILQSRIDHYRLRIENKDDFDFYLKTIFQSYADSVYNYSTTEEQVSLSSFINDFENEKRQGRNVEILQKASKIRKKNKISYKNAIMNLY